MKLSLAEGLYLIALDDEEGRLLSAAEHSVNQGLVASCIFELSIRKKVEIGADTTVKLIDKKGTGNKILDDIIKFVGQKERPIKDMITWICEHYPDIRQDITFLLMNRGIIKKEATKLLWIPVSERMDNANYAFEQEIRNNMHAIAIKGAKPPASLVVLIILIHYCHLMDEVFKDKDDLIDAVKYVKDLSNQGFVSPEIANALDSLKEYFSALG